MKTFISNPKFLLLSIFVLNLVFNIAESANVKNRSRKKVTKSSESKDVNVCDIEQTESPLFCYCNDNKLANAEEANCLIFNKLDLSDPIWGHFNSQMYIRKLNFVVRSDGSITYIPSEVLRLLKSLNTVSFQHAKLDTIEKQAFSGIHSVSTINLNKNSITALSWHTFESLRNLTILNLDENSITELSRDIFYDVPRLQKLFVNHNNISLLHDKAFSHLPSLLELELNNNKITVLTSESFDNLRMLERLDLRNNLITMIGERTFIEMPELQELDLDQNKIKFIANRAFDNLRRLKKLRLSENKLTTLEPDFLVGAPSINLLDLRENALRTVTFDNIKPVITNFYNNSSYFYLDGNQLICDCKLQWIYGLRNETKNARLRESLEELTCYLDASYESKVDSGEDFNRALEIVRNTGFQIKQTIDESQYLGDNYDEDYNEDYGSPPIGRQIEIDGKQSYVKRLFDLKFERLPCPAKHEDVMASEQPSGRRDHSSSSSIFSFVGGSATNIDSQPIYIAILLIVASLFT